MVIEAKLEETPMAQVAVSQEQESSKNVKDKGVVIEDGRGVEENGEPKKNPDGPKAAEGVVEDKKFEGGEILSSAVTETEKRDSLFKEESGLFSGLKEHEKKALMELRSKLEEAILTDNLFKEKKEQKEESDKAKSMEEEEESEKYGGGGKEKQAQEGQGKEKLPPVTLQEKEEEKPTNNGETEDKEKEKKVKHKGKEKERADEGTTTREVVEGNTAEIDKDIALWGVPLLPSKGDKGTDAILLKFLRAREFKANEAFEMLRNTLQWRKEFKIDSMVDEDFGTDYDTVAYMSGVDREGHPVCYNVYGVFGDDEVYNKTFGTQESRDKFLRWRLRLMEKEIQKLDFKPGGVSSMLQINDLKNTPGPSRKDLRLAMKQAVSLLQDNYPEFVARNIFINVPFWYYAFNAILSPFLTQRTKSKFVFTRPARVTETLLKYIAAEEIPVHYGGLKRDNDSEFSTEDGVSEITVTAGSTETIEIPAPEGGTTLVWDLTVSGWEVMYKEEFVPRDEGSYTIIVQKGRKMGWQERSIRNSFRNNEPGKVVLTIENGSFKKKRVLYRYKTKNI